MAIGNLIVFPGSGGVVPTSDAARERAKNAAELKSKLLDRAHTTEIYGPGVEEWDVKPNELMENPDQLTSRWGYRDIDAVCDDMASNVLEYGGFVEGRLDVLMSLEISWMVGIKGDPESEQARDEIEDAYLNIKNRYIVERELLRCAERGFTGAENIFDVQMVGAAKGLVTITEMFNRPQRFFAFTRKREPFLRADGPSREAQRIDDYKVTFGRQGSVHTSHGSGFAQRSYPYIWTIDKMQKQHMAAVERWSWVPIIVKHPLSWPAERQARELRNLKAQWKNVILVPDEVENIQFQTMTEAAYSNSNATGMSRMALMDRMIAAVAQLVRGSQSSGASQVGSYAKEDSVDEQRLWKAPTDAAAREAMWNAGLVEPTMLANRPTMDRAKWPRCSVDASFGEDLRLFMELCESAARNGVPIATVTWSERTGIPLAQEGDEVLSPSQPSVAPMLPDGMAADEGEDPVSGAVVRMSEPASIRVTLANGKSAWCRPSQPILTDRGIVMAKNLTGGGHQKLISAGGKRFAPAT